jgi:hypothetical protein
LAAAVAASGLTNEKAALDLGVKRVVLPATGRLSAKRASNNAGSAKARVGEPDASRINTLKHQFGMKRAWYEVPGFKDMWGGASLHKTWSP